MNRIWLLLFPLLFLGLAAPVLAQPKAPAPAVKETLTQDQARAILDTLNDPKKRAAFAATLDAMLKAQPAAKADAPKPDTTAGQPAEALPIPLEPNSLGAQVLLTASVFMTHVGETLSNAVQTAQSLPLLWAWLVVMVTNPLGQKLLLESGWRLGVALAISASAGFVVRLLLRRPMARVLHLGHAPDEHEAVHDAEARAELGETEPPRGGRLTRGLGRRARLGFGRFLLELAPIAVMLVFGHMLAASGTLGGPRDTRLMILAMVEAIALCLTLLSALTFLFQPEPAGLRLVAVPAAAGRFMLRWGWRLVLIGVPGYAIGELALLLGLSEPAHDALQKTVGFLLMLCAAAIILQSRRVVRRWLSTPDHVDSTIARLRNRLARHWYWAALFILVSAWLAWTLGAPDAIATALHYFILTALVAGSARGVEAVLDGLLTHLATVGDGGAHSIRGRLAAWLPFARQVARLLIYVFALLLLSQFFGLHGLTWLLTTGVGERVISGLTTVGVTIGLSIFIWEAVNIAIESHLETLRQQGQTARLARVRTLLPLVRTTLAITVAVVSGLMILSEIGVNIAPLLAGAGIVGVAIGFGSQKLVQDVITGVFLLLENTMQVGDVVRVGDQTGVVESLSVRTIRLRTEDGSVVVIPFSSVTTVVNMTRDFSRAVITVNVGIGEDVNRVSAVMREVARDMRAEPAWSGIILDDFEVMGLDKITDSALQIKGRLKCTPFGRWSVAREFNLRLRNRFDALNIAFPDTSTRLVLDSSSKISTPYSLSDEGSGRGATAA
jgi:small-conductance mechanosensitive channel